MRRIGRESAALIAVLVVASVAAEFAHLFREALFTGGRLATVWFPVIMAVVAALTTAAALRTASARRANTCCGS